jgi:soluble lytic murein transglycosylase-like protein
MKAGKPGNNGGGLLALAAIGAVFCSPPKFSGGWAGPLDGGFAHTRWHILRFYGAKAEPSRATIKTEVVRAARKYAISPKLLDAVVRTESAYKTRAVSRAGAIGLGQVMSSNSLACGLSSADQLFDPVRNLDCSARILSENLRLFGGNVDHALMAYNWGAGRVRAWLKSGQSRSRVPAETRAYVPQVRAHMGS